MGLSNFFERVNFFGLVFSQGDKCRQQKTLMPNSGCEPLFSNSVSIYFEPLRYYRMCRQSRRAGPTNDHGQDVFSYCFAYKF
jgi:hypothetical protein